MDRDRHTEGDHAEAQGEDERVTAVMYAQAEEHQDCRQTPEASRSKKGFFARAIRKSRTLLTPLFQTSGLWNCEMINSRF